MNTYINVFFLCLLVFIGCSKQEGCTDVSACNYDENAGIDNGSCEFAETNYDCAGGCIIDIDNDGFCDENELFIFSLGEGNFQGYNSSLWYIDNHKNIYEAPNNPLGDTGQSMYVHQNTLFVIINGTGVIHLYDISANGLEINHSFDTNFSGPRNMIVYDNKIYITEWYTSQIRVLDLDSRSQIITIPTSGMAEDIKEVNGKIYVTINMNSDWTAANSVIEINPTTFEIINTFTVEKNPEHIAVINNNLYISSTYYDENWNTFYAISKIDLITGGVVIYEQNSSLSFGPDINAVNDKLYRVTSTGAVELNINDLTINDELQISSFANVYSMDFLNEKFYFGVTDFGNLNNVIETDNSGNLLSTYSVGIIPGSFAIWKKY